MLSLEKPAKYSYQHTMITTNNEYKCQPPACG